MGETSVISVFGTKRTLEAKGELVSQLKVVAAGILCGAMTACGQPDDQGLVQLRERVTALEAAQKQTQQSLLDMQLARDVTRTNAAHWILWRSPRVVAAFVPSMAFYVEDAFSEKQACLDSAQRRVTAVGWTTTSQEPLAAANPRDPRASVVYLCLPQGVRPS